MRSTSPPTARWLTSVAGDRFLQVWDIHRVCAPAGRNGFGLASCERPLSPFAPRKDFCRENAFSWERKATIFWDEFQIE